VPTSTPQTKLKQWTIHSKLNQTLLTYKQESISDDK